MVKRPDILVLENALVAFGEGERKAIAGMIRRVMAGRTMIVSRRKSRGAATTTSSSASRVRGRRG